EVDQALKAAATNSYRCSNLSGLLTPSFSYIFLSLPLLTAEAAAVPSEPEELFDNSTYKNYEHHSYNPYTFADLDMQMAKFRLPQPSSGKPSPRH
uniref:Uncharacterized protein n=1 Tax=Neolamprologus brichardi TaxID=32507 RepID=A0A3Q4HXG1_NEOBR